jgi:hypothetical protein
MIRFGFILTIVSLTYSCTDKPKDIGKQSGTNTIYQLSYQHGGLEKDSVILLNNDNDSEFYERIQIFRGQQLILDYTEKDLELIGTSKNVFVEHSRRTLNEYFYIFKIFGGQSPNSFLIIVTYKDKTSIFGTTDYNSADIFGDIDYDGKFEIGGWTDYCQEDESNKCPDFDLYRIFEIEDSFPTDTTLTTIFKQLLKKS